MNYLRQSTASQEVLIGPFVSSTDGNTVASGLTIANTDIKVWKTGATTVVNKNSGGATHISNGLYYMTLDATDTNVIGPMRVDVHVTGALACWTNCTVLDEAVYDVMFGTVAPSTLVAGALMGLDNDAITSAKIAAGAIGASEAPLLANLDVTVSSRLATVGYTAPDNTGISEANAHAHAIDTRLPSDPADESLLQAAIATRAVAGDAMALTAGAVDAVWDEVLTGATHNVPSSSGRRLRQVASTLILDGIVVSSTDNTVTFNGDASTVDGAYDPAIISIVAGLGAGQSRLILEYDGDTKTAIVDRNWRVNPDTSSEYMIVSTEGREHVNEGRAQAGTPSTITLNPNASIYDNAYNGQVVFIRSGAGEDQARRIVSYSGSTKVATVEREWDAVPDNTSGYVMLPTAVMPSEAIGNAVLSAIVEGTLTFEEWTRLVSSVLFGKISGAPAGPLLFRDIGDTKDRITATVDADGNRLDVTTDAT